MVRYLQRLSNEKFLKLNVLSVLISSTMAWRSHGANNDELVSKLRANGIIKSDKVDRVMKSVDRGDFCQRSPYYDSPQGIGYGVTISAPHMHAYALELLEEQLKEGNKGNADLTKNCNFEFNFSFFPSFRRWVWFRLFDSLFCSNGWSTRQSRWY